MDDLINRQAAIDLAKDIYVPVKDGSIYRHRCIDPDAIRELPSVQPEQRWIPCSERLPEEGELILLCFRSTKDTPHWRIQVGHLGNHDVEDYDFQKIGVAQVWYTDRFYWSFDKVVAWMPMPKPYEG